MSVWNTLNAIFSHCQTNFVSFFQSIFSKSEELDHNTTDFKHFYRSSNVLDDPNMGQKQYVLMKQHQLHCENKANSTNDCRENSSAIFNLGVSAQDERLG